LQHRPFWSGSSWFIAKQLVIQRKPLGRTGGHAHFFREPRPSLRPLRTSILSLAQLRFSAAGL